MTGWEWTLEGRSNADVESDKGADHTLNVSGKERSFLVDTGATRSTIAAEELPGVEKSRNSAQIVGLGGKIQTLDTTAHLRVRCGPMQEKHAVLLSTTTPVNLLGRDLLCKLGCTIACTKKGTINVVVVDLPCVAPHVRVGYYPGWYGGVSWLE